MRFFRFFLISLLLPLAAFAQILIWEPVYLTEEDSVVIYYDATQGNQGLKDFSGDVYAHTGVITTASATPADWKHVVTKWGQNTPETKLERIRPNFFKFVIYPNIRQFYGISASETVLELAFVFRSANTFVQGKTEIGGDIYLPLRTGLRIQQPAADLLFSDPGDMINIFAVSTSETEQLRLLINNVPVYEVQNDTLEYVYTVSTIGQIRIRIDALVDGIITAADSFTVVVTPETEIEPRPIGLDDGINYVDEETVVLSQYAPGKAFVYVIGDFNDWQPHPDYLMKLTPDRQTWWLEINDLIPGKEYAFQYLFDGELRLATPYADKILDPWNDKHISEFTYPDLLPYPANKTNGMVSVLQTNQVPYEWGSVDFNRPDKTKLIIYELLIRDFSAKHTYAAVIDSLDYLQRLGVNTIELMPINEFDGNLSWGYNPAFYFAPDKYYGPKNELKRLVDACHARGIAVILDMVLNHSTAQSPLARMYWDKAKNQPAANNPWYNENPAPGQYDWGFEDFNHASYRTKQFVDRVNKYWLSEYNIDGYRFDFTKGFTNVPGSG
ncbi:hypothetical protein KAH55_12070, partial [bacterium]|nr:hypothetical protein [bacterium]